MQEAINTVNNILNKNGVELNIRNNNFTNILNFSANWTWEILKVFFFYLWEILKICFHYSWIMFKKYFCFNFIVVSWYFDGFFENIVKFVKKINDFKQRNNKINLTDESESECSTESDDKSVNNKKTIHQPVLLEDNIRVSKKYKKNKFILLKESNSYSVLEELLSKPINGQLYKFRQEQ